MEPESIYEDCILVTMRADREADRRRNFCRVCWGPLDECPGHQGYMEMFGPPPTEEQRSAYLADLEVRERGLERKEAALEAALLSMDLTLNENTEES